METSLKVGDVIQLMDDERFFVIHSFLIEQSREWHEVKLLSGTFYIDSKITTPYLKNREICWRQNGRKRYSIEVSRKLSFPSYINKPSEHRYLLAHCQFDEVKKVGTTSSVFKQKISEAQSHITKLQQEIDNLKQRVIESGKDSCSASELFGKLIKEQVI
jgi:hypothetical protein